MPSGKELEKNSFCLSSCFFVHSATWEGRSRKALVEVNTRLLLLSGKILHMEAKSPGMEENDVKDRYAITVDG